MVDSFVEVVKKMRQAQKEYQKLRDSTNFNTCKRLEKLVDDIIKEKEKQLIEQKQLSFF